MEMEMWAWIELAAQIEDHGTSSMQFFLDQEDPETGKNMELSVSDIKFEDGRIKVTFT